MASAIILALGCARSSGRADSTVHEAPAPAAQQLPASAEPVTKDARASREARDLRLPEASNAKTKPFVGPFAHRTNPFALPNSHQAVAAAQQRATDKRMDERLLGFVNVDGRKALLQIDGKLWAARPGESRDGIEVVEIAPAHVTLRRDGATWSLSLTGRVGSG